jgi:hypothetical protein
MSGQPHVRAALPLQELLRYLLSRRLGETQILSGQNYYRKESLALGRDRIASFIPLAEAILFVLSQQFKYLKAECTRWQNIQFSTNKNA